MKWLWVSIGFYVAFVAALVIWASGRIDPAHLAPIAYSAHPVNAAEATDPAAIAALVARARAGDAAAQVQVGRAYFEGRGLPQDNARAAVWYARSAAQGNAEAQARLGWAYHAGAGVPHDELKAAVWLSRAQAQGNAAAAAQLATVRRALTPAQRAAAERAAQARQVDPRGGP